MKPLDHKLLFELMKNAKRSDSKLAKILGVSQPTVTRTRKRLEKQVIDGYTAIPKWEKLGYKILAFTFVKSDVIFQPYEKQEAARKKVKKWMMNQSNVIAAGRGQGMEMSGFFVSIHKSFSDYRSFISKHNLDLGTFITDIETFLVSTTGLSAFKPFHLKYLAETEQ